MKNHNSYKFVGFFLVLFLFAASLTFAQESQTKKADIVKKTTYTKTVNMDKKDCKTVCPYSKKKQAKMTSKNKDNCSSACKAKHGKQLKAEQMKAKQIKVNTTDKVKMTQTMKDGHKCNVQCKNGCTAKS